MSEPWSPYTKRIVTIIGLIACSLLLWRFRQIIQPLIVATLIAYVLAPVVDFSARRLRAGRTPTTVLIYVALLAVLLTLPAVIIPIAITQARAINVDFQQFSTTAQAWLDYTVRLGMWSFNVQTLVQEISDELSNMLASLATGTLSLVVDAASILLQGFFVLIISFYMVKDMPAISAFFDGLPPSSTRSDFRKLRQEISRVWNAFLRGQVILCLVIGVVVSVTMSIVGLRSALTMGLLAGTLEFIPNLGPVIATIPAVLLAWLNGSSWLPVSNSWFAVLVVVLYMLIQQVENNYLVPRILGEQLELHPLAVLIAVVAGASLAGILGIFLAAPVLATLRVLARYAYRKLQDQDPFPPSPPTQQSPSLWYRLKELVSQRHSASRPAHPIDDPVIDEHSASAKSTTRQPDERLNNFGR